MRRFTLAAILVTATALGALHAAAAPLSKFVGIPIPGGSWGSFTSSVTAASIPAPEPASMAILGSGLLGLGLITPMRRRRAAGNSR